MKKKWQQWVSLLVLTIVAFWSAGLVDAKSLEITKYHIDAAIQANGDVQFSEEITFEANGSYNGIYYNLDYATVEQPKDVSVLLKTGESLVTLSEAFTGERGTYTKTYEADLLKYKVYAPFSNSQQTLVFRYTIPHLITNYLDTAELNRRVVGSNWEMDQSNITVHISLPGAATYETLRAWGHGGVAGTVKIDEDYRGVTYIVPRNSEGNFVETHVIFPQTLTPDNTNVVNENRFDAIITQEEALITQRENMRQVGRVLVWVGAVIAVLSMVLAGVKGYYANKKRLEKVPFVPDHLFDVPQDMTPAIMSEAIYDGVNITDFGATVMDLVRKKVIRMSEQEPYSLELLSHQQKLLEHEEFVVHVLFVDIAKGNTLDLERVKEFSEENPQRYKALLDRWMCKVERNAKPFSGTNFQKGESKATAPGAIALGVLGLLITMVGMVLAGFALVQFNVIAVIVGVVVGITVILSGVLAKRRTLDGEYEYRRWNAFRQMLVDLSSLERAEVAAIQLWDHLLVYAISLGVAEQVIEVLSDKFPEVLESSLFYSSDYGWQMMTYHLLLENTFHDSYDSATASVQETSSNSGGHGGGFSGGSSFGSGGSSGGGGF